MANVIDQAISYFSPERGAARAKARYMIKVLDSRAGYDAAGKGRRNEWSRGSDSSQNGENKLALPVMRARHRELVRNNPYASVAMDVSVAKTIGSGLMASVRHADADKAKAVQELFNRWAESTFCDADGVSNFYALQALSFRGERESGETITQRFIDRSVPMEVPLRLRVMEGDFIDHHRDGTIDNRETVQGISFDSSGNRHSYWLHQQHPGDRQGLIKNSRPVPANQICHLFEVKRPGQVRGIPAGASVMTRLRNLDDFQDARLEQQKVAACLVGFIQQGEDGKKQGDPLPERMEPGLLARLGLDEAVHFNTPPSVSGQQEMVHGEEHMIARGYGINFQAMTGNLASANFANSKIGRLDMYANVRRWRQHMIVPQQLNQVGQWWLMAAELGGHDVRGITIDWLPPREEILNLRDEIPAMIKKVRGGFGVLSDELRSMGIADPRKFLEDYKKDLDLFDELGLVLDSDPRQISGSGQLQSNNSATLDGHDNSEKEEPKDED